MVLSYYTPHTSGLTIYVERLSQALVRAGHQVTVLCSHHDTALPPQEIARGVHVVRAPVALKVHKGVIMPTFPFLVTRLMREHDVVHLHLPLLEAGLVGLIARLITHTPVVITYHCDLRLPRSAVSKPIIAVMRAMHYLGGACADRIVTYTRDYASHSPFMTRYPSKAETVYPPIVQDPPNPAVVARCRAQWGLEGRRVVGFAGRFAAEKGVEHLLATIPTVAEHFPDVVYVFAGEYARVLGEDQWQRLQPVIRRFEQRTRFLGVLRGPELAAFYALCDVLVLPSVNSTESFGLVQVEAMLCGTPVVASDLPGVREAVRVTGMGEIAPIANPPALAERIERVLRHRERYLRPREDLLRIFDLARTVQFYEGLYERVVAAGRPVAATARARSRGR